MNQPIIHYFSQIPATLNFVFDRLTHSGYQLKAIGPDDIAAQVKNIQLLIFPISNQTNLTDFEVIFNTCLKDFEGELVALFSGRLKLKTTDLYKQGVTSLFQIPLEEEMFINKVFSLIPIDLKIENLEYQDLLKVSIYEIEKVKKIPFDLFVYLPTNKKIVQYLNEGDTFSEKTKNKFRENQSYSLFIKRSDIKKYNDFCTHLIRIVQTDTNLNDQEKTKKLQDQVSNMMNPFFNDDELTTEESEQMLANMDQVLCGLTQTDQVKKNLDRELTRFAAQKWTNATHSQNVGTYCALFGIALGFKEVRELRLGGLLHDVGLSDFSPELFEKDYNKMTDDEKSRYHLHPGNAKVILEQKKIKTDPRVIDMILYHHEKMDGSGYPYGKKSNEISDFAKICAFANEFDKLTSIREGYTQLTPCDAMRQIAGLSDGKASPYYDEKFHKPIIDLYLKQKEAKADSLKNKMKTNTEEIQKKVGRNTISLLKIKNQVDQKAKAPAQIKLDPQKEAQAQKMVEELKNHFQRLMETM